MAERVSSVAELEGVLANGVPGLIVIVGAETVAEAAIMMEVVWGFVAAANGADNDDGDDDDVAAGDDNEVVGQIIAGGWTFGNVDLLATAASLADEQEEVSDVLVPGLIANPRDEELLRRLNNIAKDIGRDGRALRDDGYSAYIARDDAVPFEDGGTLTNKLFNKVHKMVALAFRECGGNHAVRTEEECDMFVEARLANLLNQVVGVRGARIGFG